MGKYCSHLLADYLNVLSGHSLGGIGLKRSVLVCLYGWGYLNLYKLVCFLDFNHCQLFQNDGMYVIPHCQVVAVLTITLVCR
jgi:hypothetical protein